MTVTLGSLFDGSGGFPLAGSLCGFKPLWAAEVEPYPIAVTRSRFPKMKHLGSVTDIHGAEIPPVDVITFGSPCQDLSVAGKRAGLKHEGNGDEETTRSGLFMEAVRIIKEMRSSTNGKYPRFAIWENVPGAFSSNKGEDFRVVIEELLKIIEPDATVPAPPKGKWPYADAYVGDGWSLAYRTFDAQYWGVPQRRRRIYLVADFAGGCAPGILFEREGLRGYFAASGAERKGVAADAEGSLGTDDSKAIGLNCLNPWDAQTIRQYDGAGIYPALSANSGGGQNRAGVCIAVATQQGGAEITEDGICPTVTAAAGMSGNNQPWICESIFCIDGDKIGKAERAGGSGLGIRDGDKMYTLTVKDARTHAVAYGISSYDSNAMKSSNPKSGIYEADTSRTLDLNGGNPACHQGGIAIVQTAGFKQGQGPKARSIGWEEEKSPSLAAEAGGNSIPSVCVCYDARGNGDGDIVSTITGDHENRITDYTSIVCEAIPIHDQATRFSGKRGDKSDGKGNGLGIGEPNAPMNTLTSGDRHAVAFAKPIAIDRAFFNQGKNAQYEPQLYTDGTVSTLVAKGPSAVAHYWDGGQTCGTLTSKNAADSQRMPDKDNFNCVIEHSKLTYIVRRLTPVECARLQGFADEWGHIDTKDDFTEEEYQFWLKVRNTHAAINNKAVKDYTKEQMLKWYNKLHSKSSEYKMWGNGVALPPTLYVMQGVQEAIKL